MVSILGKSGAGKSEIGFRLFNSLKSKMSNLIYLDGDELREAISWDLKYTIQDRYISEKRRSNLCKLLSEQGISIICSALSNAPELRQWNKENIEDYIEIYLKVDKNVLHKRDKKKIYRKFKNNMVNNVVGEDIEFFEPESPWLTIINNDNEGSFDKIITKILSSLKNEKLIS